MRNALLLGTVLTAFSIGTAMASDHDRDHHHHHNPAPLTFEVSVAAALAGNQGKVAGNEARSESQATGTSITDGSFNGTKGVGNTNQNAGANSVLQNALALSYIQGCSCATTVTIAAGGALAASGNNGEVAGNSSSNSREKTVHFEWRHHHPRIEIHYGPKSTVSANIDGSYNAATGVFQVNENSGDNSLLQNSAAVAAADGLKGASLDLGLAVAAAGNEGEVEHNRASTDGTINTGTINNSFSLTKGVVNVNQNTGANSQLQNASSLAALKFCGCATDNLSLAVSVAGNEGGVYGNHASAENGSNNANMSSSFSGSTGVMQVSQNAGANSLLQNSVAVGVILHSTP